MKNEEVQARKAQAERYAAYAVRWALFIGRRVSLSPRGAVPREWLLADRANNQEGYFREDGFWNDHGRLWNAAGRPFLYTSEPYQHDSGALHEFCKRNALEYRTLEPPYSPYSPGSTELIEIAPVGMCPWQALDASCRYVQWEVK